MKRTIRCGVFETNSSSVHSLTMCTDKEWEAWNNGELYLYNESLITKEKLIAIMKERSWWGSFDFDKMTDEEWEEFCDDHWIYTKKSWEKHVEDGYYETFSGRCTTPGGETIHAFGYYGHS